MERPESIKANIREYYGKVLQDKKDLKTSACCSIDTLPPAVRAIMKDIEPEILNRFYGCGSPLPPVLEGQTILDLGCGTGRDVYVAAKLAGQDGYVIGVDMTEEQLEVANRYLPIQIAHFGFKDANVTFKKGFIEELSDLGIADNSVDVVISNCVLNLSPDKPKVFSEIFRVLKPGGELYFSDVFAGCRVPEDLREDPVLRGECLAGAMYIEDFRRLLKNLGCADYRVVSCRKIEINDPESFAKIGQVDFYSMTVRAFKISILEDICEDYGQVAVYKGTVLDQPHYFDLDDHHRFISGKPMLVCGNTAAMLGETRYAGHFDIHGDRSVHYGPFECKSAAEKKNDQESGGGACC